MNKTKGCIFDIQRFSLHDGPGIRTTVFFKGCNLRCFWCHNPESINPEPEIQLFRHKCIGCRKCLNICPEGAIKIQGTDLIFLRQSCIKCGKCVDECFAEARVMTGRYISVDDAVNEIVKDAAFYRTSEGGVTFSGGEPMLQAGFLLALLKECKRENIHTAVDTAGNIPFERFVKVIPYTDLFLYDLKVMDEKTHIEATKVSNKRILNNLILLSQACENIIIRIPVIPGVNDNENNMRQTGEFLKNLKNIRLVELLSFHKMASGKYEGLGHVYEAEEIDVLEKDHMMSLRDILSEYVADVKTS